MDFKNYKKALVGSLIFMQMTTFSLPALGANGLQNFTQKQNVVKPNFEDVKEGQWYKEVIKSCYEMGLMVGKSEKRFDPQGQVSLAEAICFAVRIHSTYNGNVVDETEEQASGKWYDGAVAYAIKHQIIEEGAYTDLDRPATRAEVANIIAKSLPEDQWQQLREIKVLPDVTEATPYYNEIMKLYKAGVLTGSDDYGTFKCDTSISRAETAAILNRIVVMDNRCRLPIKVLEHVKQIIKEEPTKPAPAEPKSPTPSKPENPTPVDPKPSQPEAPVTNPDTSLSAYAAEVLRLVNVERQKAGLNPVNSLTSVTGAANIRAKELETQFSHTRPNGSSPFTVLDGLNENFRTMGENIAMGQRTPEEVMKDWMNSSGHRKNILNPSFTGMGVGVYKTASGSLCWVQLFVG